MVFTFVMFTFGMFTFDVLNVYVITLDKLRHILIIGGYISKNDEQSYSAPLKRYGVKREHF